MGGGDTVMQRRLLDGIKIRVETAGLEDPKPHIARTGGSRMLGLLGSGCQHPDPVRYLRGLLGSV